MTLTRSGPTAERLALAARVRELRQHGLTHAAVAECLGITRSYASALADDPDGSKARARKERYAGCCVDCDAPTSGSNGREAAPERCNACSLSLQSSEKKWTREAVIDAIQRFAAAHGRPPVASEWRRADPGNDYPPATSCYGDNGAFARWADAVEAAGFPRPTCGRRPNAPPPRERKIMASQKRPFVILEQDDNGSWVQHDPVDEYTESLAIERFVAQLGDMNGRASHKFVAISEARFVVRQLSTVTVHKAVVVA